MSIRGADVVIQRYLRRVEEMITLRTPGGRKAAIELLRVLVEADRSLDRRLTDWVATHGGPEMRFSEASMRSYQVQVKDVLRVLSGRLRGITTMEAMRTARQSAQMTSQLFAQLERAFTGIARPIRIDEAMVARLQPSLLKRHATSVDRYGSAMIDRVQSTISQGFVEGISQGEMVDRLVSMRGPAGTVSLRAVEVQPGMVVRVSEEEIPEGLFVRYRSWPWRVVRTEVAEAQNAVSLEGIKDGKKTFPDMQKKILAVMDQRTAWDSIAVHGQVRDINEPFVDGKGRSYQRPPARPHDRETVIPWRKRWSETPHSRELPRGQAEDMWSHNQEWQEERAQERAGLNRWGSGS